MSGTTTKFGWTYPTSTDYVKDGASAMQTIAQSIDTTFGTSTVIQKKVYFYSTAYSTTTSGLIPNFLVTITPKFANSKLLITITGQICASSTGYSPILQLAENGTGLGGYDCSARIVDNGTTFTASSISVRTPGVTTPVTYQVNYGAPGGGVTGYLNRTLYGTTGVSAITVEELLA